MAKKKNGEDDTANVVALTGLTEPKKDAAGVTEVVDLLDGLLAQARRGELRGIAVAGVRSNGAATRAWAQEDKASSTLAAAVGDLFYSIHAEREDAYEFSG